MVYLHYLAGLSLILAGKKWDLRPWPHGPCWDLRAWDLQPSLEMPSRARLRLRRQAATELAGAREVSAATKLRDLAGPEVGECNVFRLFSMPEKMLIW